MSQRNIADKNWSDVTPPLLSVRYLCYTRCARNPFFCTAEHNALLEQLLPRAHQSLKTPENDDWLKCDNKLTCFFFWALMKKSFGPFTMCHFFFRKCNASEFEWKFLYLKTTLLKKAKLMGIVNKGIFLTNVASVVMWWTRLQKEKVLLGNNPAHLPDILWHTWSKDSGSINRETTTEDGRKGGLATSFF